MSVSSNARYPNIESFLPSRSQLFKDITSTIHTVVAHKSRSFCLTPLTRLADFIEEEKPDSVI